MSTHTPKFPIQQLRRVIEGEGPWTGDPVILLRIGIHEAIEGLHVTPNPLHKDDPVYMTADAICEACAHLNVLPSNTDPAVKTRGQINYVHIGGEDPLLCEGFEDLTLRLLDVGYRVMVDTFAMVPFSNRFWVEMRTHDRDASALFLSVCPRPSLPCDDTMLAHADEVRLYVSAKKDEWNDLTNRVIRTLHMQMRNDCRVSIMPRDMTPADIQMTFDYCLRQSLVRCNAAIPLYRICPAVDDVFDIGGDWGM